MPRQRDYGEDEVEPEEEEEEEEEDEDDRGQKRRRSHFIDDDHYGGRRRRTGLQFIDFEAAVDSDEDEEEEDAEDDFIVDGGAEIPDEDGARREYRHRLLPQEDQEEDLEELTRSIQQRYARSAHVEYDEEATDVEQQALLPSVRDPKLWMVKCAIGQERKVAVCLMQKAIDRGPELQIRSVVALDHLQNYIYIEADKEAHVREACKGMRDIYTANVKLVPIKEMTDVLMVESKAVDLARDSLIRMKTGTYKGDLAMVVHVDDMDQKVIVKLIPRIDLRALANNFEGREVTKKKAVIPPPRLMNIDEARVLNIRVERKRDMRTGDYFDNIGSMSFRDGFLYKSVAMKSISTQNIHPTFDELERFRRPGESGDGDMASLSILFANRKKGRFMKGDRVIVVKGDLRKMEGHVEKVEEDTVHIRPNQKGLPETLAFSDKEIRKHFEPGNHVKVICGSSEGATGIVASVEGHVVNLVSDTTKEPLSVFADNVVLSSEVTSGLTRIGEYELHDLVILDNKSFGVIIRVDSEAFQVLKGVPDRPDVALVRLREIKGKVEKRGNAQDHFKNQLAVKDVVKVIEGPCKGKQGHVEHIFRGVIFIYDRHHLEHAGFICAKTQSCVVIGGSRANGDRNGNPFSSRFAHFRTPPRAPQSPMRSSRGGPPMSYGGRHRGGRGHDALVGVDVKIRLGTFKGCKGRVVDIKGTSVRVELEAQMKVVTVDRNHIVDSVNMSTPFWEPSGYGLGSETPSHPSKTPLRTFMTPMRDPATPIHDGMRTLMRDRAWNPMSPPRDSWEDGNPASWGSSPQYQPSSPRSSAYEAAPTPGSGWTSTPSGNYSDSGTPRDNGSACANASSPYLPSTPGGQPPMTPSSAYVPGTPGGQPMTPGSGALDMMSPLGGGDTESPWLLPDILVNVRKSNDDTVTGVVREVLADGSCSVALRSSGSGDTIIAHATEIEIVVPEKSDKIKIIGGPQRGSTGKLIGVDGTDGIVKVDDTLDVKILDMVILAKLANAE
ncbi:putative transcription elongation factor SPT5 homolog 1 [Nicotiana sylvestris]|uniref:putative transcription elongation factor SPT5 homolog 1 n=1 Tax=Nicotiana sylvestris TaxID=4096 RepID=UPI00388CBFE3